MDVYRKFKHVGGVSALGFEEVLRNATVQFDKTLLGKPALINAGLYALYLNLRLHHV